MVVKDFSALKKRVCRFLSSKKFERGEVYELIELTRKVGRVAIFGGMIRDLCIGGNRFFDSDVDLVIEQQDKTNLEVILKDYKYELNSFGGYRLHLKKWQVDIWNIENTWAFKNNVVQNCGVKSLVGTTFFNWDAIIYEIDSGTIYADEKYLQNLHERYLDINMVENPNILSTLVRALRMVIKLDARLSPRLRNFLCVNMVDYSTEDIVTYEQKKYWRSTLTNDVVSDIFLKMELHKRNYENDPFELPSKQYILPF